MQSSTANFFLFVSFVQDPYIIDIIVSLDLREFYVALLCYCTEIQRVLYGTVVVAMI